MVYNNNAMKKYNLLLLIPFLLCGCTQNPSVPDPSDPGIISSLDYEVDPSIIVYDYDEEIVHNTELQLSYLNDPDYENVPEIADGNHELSIPEPFELVWSFDYDVEQYELFISEHRNMKDSMYYVFDKDIVNIYNLKLGTDYYYAVKDKDADVISKTGHFKTSSEGIRNLKIDGVTNTRDLGGKTLKNGKKFVQGNVYRCANADNITFEGKEEMNRLGIKTEIDLRDTGTLNASPIGENVDYYAYKMYYNDYSNYLERNCEAVKKVFKVLANEDAYPLCYHCRIGTDRTGIITYLLLGLLGAEEEDIYRDYLFSNFGLIEDVRTLHGKDVNNVQLYYDAINDFPGTTLQEHIFNFLISIGLSEEELETIIELNTEDVSYKDLDVLIDDRPIVINAEDFELDEGLKMAGNDIRFVSLNRKPNLGFGAYFSIEEEKQYDFYFYMYTNNLKIKACDAFSLTIDGVKMAVTDKTFNNLHYRSTSGIYVASRLASESLEPGDYYLKMTNIVTDNNASALGADVARVIIIPRPE